MPPEREIRARSTEPAWRMPPQHAHQPQVLIYAGDPLRKVLLTYLISDSGTTSPAHELRCFTDVACNPVEQD
jgi:hypothetical protein